MFDSTPPLSRRHFRRHSCFAAVDPPAALYCALCDDYVHHKKFQEAAKVTSTGRKVRSLGIEGDQTAPIHSTAAACSTPLPPPANIAPFRCMQQTGLARLGLHLAPLPPPHPVPSLRPTPASVLLRLPPLSRPHPAAHTQACGTVQHREHVLHELHAAVPHGH